jgi:integrase
MPLTVWKNHSKTCKKTHQKEFAKLELKEHRFFKKCGCACWVTGVHPVTKQEIKKSLGTTSWEAAQALRLQMEIHEPKTLEAQKMTIKEAFKQYYLDKKREGVGDSTLMSSYEWTESILLGFAKDHNLELLSQLDSIHIRKLIATPRWLNLKASSANKQLTTLSGFFEYCIVCKWIKTDENPILGVKRQRDIHSQMVDPFTLDQQRQLEVAFRYWTEGRRVNQGQWSSRPQTLLALKHVLEDTGLRISDVLRFQPCLVTVLPSGDGEWTLIQSKLDGPWSNREHAQVTVYLRRSTLEEVNASDWCSAKYPFMLQPRNENDRSSFKRHLRKQGIVVWNTMQVIGEFAGINDVRPHRFRHTFADKMLLGDPKRGIPGKPMEEVARYLGHKSTKMLESYYGKWTPERQAQLRDKRLQEFEAERSSNNVIQMPERKVG